MKEVRLTFRFQMLLMVILVAFVGCEDSSFSKPGATGSSKTITLLKEKLDIPKDYTIFFTSSATECWEILAQSLIVTRSFHIYNGAFGEKWYDYTLRLKPAAQA